VNLFVLNIGTQNDSIQSFTHGYITWYLHASLGIMENIIEHVNLIYDENVHLQNFSVYVFLQLSVGIVLPRAIDRSWCHTMDFESSKPMLLEDSHCRLVVPWLTQHLCDATIALLCSIYQIWATISIWLNCIIIIKIPVKCLRESTQLNIFDILLGKL